MQDQAKSRIDIVIAYHLSVSKRGVADKLQGIIAAQAAKGILASGATIKVALRQMEEVADGLIATLATELGDISLDPAAGEAFVAAMKSYIQHCRDLFPEILRVTRASRNEYSAAYSAARGAFNQMVNDIDAKMTIGCFRFDGQKSIPLPAPTALVVQSAKGGRPRADFWDDLWAWTAAALYSGDLVAKSQADIERAMIGWIESKGQSAAPSTVRIRARRLWDAIDREAQD